MHDLGCMKISREIGLDKRQYSQGQEARFVVITVVINKLILITTWLRVRGDWFVGQ